MLSGQRLKLGSKHHGVYTRSTEETSASTVPATVPANEEADSPLLSFLPIPPCIAPKGSLSLDFLSLHYFSTPSFLAFSSCFFSHLLTNIWINGDFSSSSILLDPG